MDKLDIFVERMSRIGIDIELGFNFPWIYLDRINGVEVTEKYLANHGHTIAFYPTVGYRIEFTSIPRLFELVRKYTYTSTKK